MNTTKQEARARSGALRTTIVADYFGVLVATATGPFGHDAARDVFERMQREVAGVPAAVVLDLKGAVVLFAATRALNLCDRVTGVAALGAPVAIVAPWAASGLAAWFEVESAKRGLIRRVFVGVPQAKRWARELAMLTARA